MSDLSIEERFASLSPREREVLQLVCKHKSYQEVADQLFIEKTTIKTHMNNAYSKLGLKYLDRTERILRIHTVFCPMFWEEEEPEIKDIVIIDSEADLPPLSPEEDEMLDQDELALVSYQFGDVAGGKKPKKPKRGGCRRFIGRLFFILILLGGIGVYGWYQWQNGNLDLPFDLQGFIAEAAPPATAIPTNNQALLALTDLVASVNAPSVSPTATRVPTKTPTNSLSPTKTPKPSNTPNPTPTSTPKSLITGPVYEIGEWHQEDGVAIRLLDYETDFSYIYFIVEFWNKSDQTLYFTWKPETHTFVIDNLGRRFTSLSGYDNNTEVEAGERLILNNFRGNIAQFDVDFIYDANVTDIYLLIEDLSRIEKVYFHIEIGK